LAAVHPKGARRGRPAEEVIDRELVAIRVSALQDPRPAGWPRPARRRVLDTPYGRAA
jgi:hypothetical protein